VLSRLAACNAPILLERLRAAAAMASPSSSSSSAGSPVHASGSPILWMRENARGNNSGRRALARSKSLSIVTGKTFAEVTAHLDSLNSLSTELRVAAMERLSMIIVDKPDVAQKVMERSQILFRCLKPGGETRVRLAMLGLLRSLAETGEAASVGLRAPDILDCLQDTDVAVQRKACALLRVIAEEGGASLVAAHVTRLVECFAASESSLAAPLDALTAVADGGESDAVAQCLLTLSSSLEEGHSSIVRVAACKTLASMIAGGGGALLRRLGLLEEAISRRAVLNEANAGKNAGKPLFQLLVVMALDDPDREARFAAADALRSITEADPECRDVVRERYAFPLFGGVCCFASERDDAFWNQIIAILGLDERALVRARRWRARPGVSSELCSSSDVEDCVICQVDLRSQLVEVLPCKHSFHSSCLSKWFNWKVSCGHQRTCPVCRWTNDPPPPPRAVAAQAAATTAPAALAAAAAATTTSAAPAAGASATAAPAALVAASEAHMVAPTPATIAHATVASGVVASPGATSTVTTPAAAQATRRRTASPARRSASPAGFSAVTTPAGTPAARRSTIPGASARSSRDARATRSSRRSLAATEQRSPSSAARRSTGQGSPQPRTVSSPSVA